jgi:AcrR family transcriptional regulator
MAMSGDSSRGKLRRRREPGRAKSRTGSQPRVVKSRSRNRILAAARELFVSSGYQETSMAQIAREAGVARATIYNNFPDKVALLAALVQDYLRGYIEIAQRLQASIPANQTTFEHLESMIREGISWRLAHADLFPLIDLAKHVPGSSWHETNAESDKVWLDWMMVMHRGNAEAGLLRDGLDLDFSVKALFSMVETTLITFDNASSAHLVDRVAHEFALLQWHALYDANPSAAPLMHHILDGGAADGRRARARRARSR